MPGGLVTKAPKRKGAFQEWMPGREEGRRNSEHEQEEGRTSQQFVYPRQAGSLKALQRVVWSFIFLVFGVRMAKLEPEIQTRKNYRKKTLIQFSGSTSDGRGWFLGDL